jgi:hypothetical protein
MLEESITMNAMNYEALWTGVATPLTQIKNRPVQDIVLAFSNLLGFRVHTKPLSSFLRLNADPGAGVRFKRAPTSCSELAIHPHRAGVKQDLLANLTNSKTKRPCWTPRSPQ